MKSFILNLSGLAISFMAIGLSSCQKDEEAVKPTEQYRSKFKGVANAFPHNRDSILVTIENGSIIRETYTNETGLFSFDSLETGTYNLTYEKEGHGTYKTFGVRHFGFPSDTLVKVSAYIYEKALSTVNTTGEVIHDDFEPSYNMIFFELGISVVQEKQERVIVFFGRKPDVSKDSYDFYLTKDYSPYYPNRPGADALQGIILQYREIAKNGYKSGDKIYFKFYTINYRDSGYQDYDLKRQIFPTISDNDLPAVEHTLSL